MRFRGLIVVGLMLLGGLAFASGDDEVDDEDRAVRGRPLPPLQLEQAAESPVEGRRRPDRAERVEIPEVSAEAQARMAEMVEAAEGQEFPTMALRGAEILQMEPAFVHGVQQGLNLFYERRYDDAVRHFHDLEKEHPGTAVAAISEVLKWQALMIENFDFRYEQEWQAASRRARQALEAGLRQSSNKAWGHFMMAGVAGIESIHTMRRERYLPALQLAFEAMDHVRNTKAAAPDLVDLLLADGMYNYWRTVVTLSSRVLPDFGDHRVVGIQQMQVVENGGIFLRDPASLAMAFTWLEERDMRRAISTSGRLRRAYPDNVINNLLLGRIYTNARRFTPALEIYEHVLKVAPDNRRVHYYRGMALLRSGHSDQAEQSFLTYLGFDHLERYQRSATLFRLGQVYYRQRDYERAEENWRAAIRLDGNRHARSRLDRMRQLRRQGRLPQ